MVELSFSEKNIKKKIMLLFDPQISYRNIEKYWGRSQGIIEIKICWANEGYCLKQRSKSKEQIKASVN